jgi:hypothetical protein
LERFDPDLALSEVTAGPPPGSRFAFWGVDEPMTEGGPMLTERDPMRRGSVWGMVAFVRFGSFPDGPKWVESGRDGIPLTTIGWFPA